MEEKDIIVTSKHVVLGDSVQRIGSMQEVESFMFAVGWKVEPDSIRAFLNRGHRFSIEAHGVEYAFRKA